MKPHDENPKGGKQGDEPKFSQDNTADGKPTRDDSICTLDYDSNPKRGGHY